MDGPGELIERLLDETREEIDRADTKANILLGAVGIVVAALISAMLSAGIRIDNIDVAVWVLGAISTGALGFSISSLGAAVRPRLGHAIPGRARYFMDHAQYRDIEKLRRAIEYEVARPQQRNLEQLSELARIVRTKYRLSVVGEYAAGLGLLTSAITAYFYFS